MLDKKVQLLQGDCIEVLRTLPDNSIDAIVTDPPYLIGFMGKEWDADDGIAGKPLVWQECLRVLKPGGHLLSFGGTRTYHRMVCAIEDAGFEVRDSIHWIYGSGFPKSLDVSKAIDKAAGAEREVVGANPNHRSVSGVGYEGVYAGGNTGAAALTAPATDAARQWSGWGTALKPAFEPVVVAVKPATIGSCLSQLSARVAAECSKSNPSAFVVAFASALRSVAPTFATQGASSEATATSQYESDKTLSWNTVRSWQNTWAEVSIVENTFIIGTETRPTTDLRTLLSCLSRITDANTLVRESEFLSLVHLAANLFLVSTHRLNAIRTLAAIESVTAKSLTNSPDADVSGPHEPVVVARKPLIGTVAENVQQHGTGALNIDGTRVGTDGGGTHCANRNAAGKCLGRANAGRSTSGETFRGPDTVGGRWPPNILLTHTPECGKTCAEDCPVAEMDRQSGTSKSTGGRTVRRSGGGNVGSGKASEKEWSNDDPGYGDSGGASRFFPVFRYQAKASRKERNMGLEGMPEKREADRAKADGPGGDNPRNRSNTPKQNHHPCVKPISLMEWLVKLVTPPNGTVLDPFMGSGSTGIAAVRQGFSFVGIEREAEYFELAEKRIGAVGAKNPEQMGIWED